MLARNPASYILADFRNVQKSLARDGIIVHCDIPWREQGAPKVAFNELHLSNSYQPCGERRRSTDEATHRGLESRKARKLSIPHN